MTLPTGFKGRFITTFPSRALAGDGISVTKAGGVYTISQNIGAFAELASIIEDDSDNLFLTLYDSDSDGFFKCSLETLLIAVTTGLDPTLAAIAGLTGTANKGLYFSGPDTAVLYDLTAGGRALGGVTAAVDKFAYFTSSSEATTTDLTAFARTILDDASASAVRTTLGLVIGTNVQAYAAPLASLAAAAGASATTFWRGDGAWVNGTPHSTTRTQTGATYTYAATDSGVAVLRSNSGSAMIDTLPTGATLTANTFLTIQNNDASALLSATTSAALDGVTGGILYLGPGQSAQFHWDGTSYRTLSKPARCRVAANTTLYVDISKSNSNSGLTAAAAWATPTFAYETLRDKFDGNGFTITVSLANGSYTAGMTAAGPVPGIKGPANLIFLGNTGSPASVSLYNTLSTSVAVSAGAQLWLRGVRIGSTPTNGLSVIDAGSRVHVDTVDFNFSGGSHNYCSNFGQVIVVGNYTISSEASTHITCVINGFFDAEGAYTYSFVNPVSYNFVRFARAEFGGIIDHKTGTFSLTGGASVVGARYLASGNGIIHTQGGGANYFPGNAAGATAAGGYYD